MLNDHRYTVSPHRRLLQLVTLAAVVSFASGAWATLLLSPADCVTPTCGTSQDQSGNNEDQKIIDVLGLDLDADDLTLVYKQDAGGGEAGTFEDLYNTTLNGDFSGGTINWNGSGTDFIICPECYLAVKDGNHDPAYYIYDIGNWDGRMDIVLSGFWLGPGAISHVSIWNAEGDEPPGGGEIPEPTTVALLSLGLLGLGYRRNRKSV